MNEEESKSEVYALRTTIGQEKSTANMLTAHAKNRNLPIKSVLVPQDIRGYIFVEAGSRRLVDQARSGIKHAKGVIRGNVPFKEIEDLVKPRSTVGGIDIGNVVELSAGPFKGERARVIRVDESNEEATVELFEAAKPIPVTVRGDHIRVVERKEEEE